MLFQKNSGEKKKKLQSQGESGILAAYQFGSVGKPMM